MRKFIFFLLLAAAVSSGRELFYDRTHRSQVFGEERHYRILLPPDYETSGRHYPVIYYLHGHSDRYTVEKYDNGTDTIPKMADFVAKHPVIVVTVDGYVARDYTGFYGGAPWDIAKTGGEYDFGLYFQELAAHIDSTYRTMADRRRRGISGLSMGGFMSLVLSARYPHLIGSASSFNPGPELYVGPKGERILWRPKDHVANHGHSVVRLIRASGDYISQYHEETKEAYARASEVDFEYRRDEYHRHWATSIGETFDFHMRAFANPALNNVPASWSHGDAYRSFEVWGWKVASEGPGPAVSYLEDVTQGGFRVMARRWAPDGPALADRVLTITTAPLYRPRANYQVLDFSLATGKLSRSESRADEQGRLTVKAAGDGHQISFAGPGTGAQPPVLLPLTARDKPRVEPGRELTLPIRIYNPRAEPLTDVKAAVSSEYPTVRITAGGAVLPKIEPGTALPVTVKAVFTAGAGYFAHARLRLDMTYDGWYQASKDIDVEITPEVMPSPLAVEILDGRTVTLPVFRQKGNQGGGSSLARTVTEGKGNGNGILEPGEEATIWVQMRQGMDPFDKNNWYRARVHTDSPLVTEVDIFEESKQREWTAAQERTSIIRLSKEAPAGARVPLVLDNESWSFHFTPDVRYGRELLYQAFQLHTRHLHRYELTVR